MTLEALIDEIEKPGADARATLRPHRGAGGLCVACFDRLLAVWAGDPARAARLAGHWRVLLDLGDDPALAYRAKGAADRVAGRYLASARAFVRAGDLARGETERLSYAVGAIDCFGKVGRIEEAVALGARLADGLDARGESALAARARRTIRFHIIGACSPRFCAIASPRPLSPRGRAFCATNRTRSAAT